MQSAIEYAAIPTINLTPLFLVTNPFTNSSQSSDRPQEKTTTHTHEGKWSLFGEILLIN